MNNATQYLIANKEILELIIKNQGVHEGFWVLSAEFNFTAAYTGPSPETATPSAIVGISKIGIQRTDTLIPNAVDAAAINPASKAAK